MGSRARVFPHPQTVRPARAPGPGLGAAGGGGQTATDSTSPTRTLPTLRQAARRRGGAGRGGECSRLQGLGSVSGRGHGGERPPSPPSPAGETKHMNATRRDPTRPGRPRAKTRAAAGTAPGFGAPPSPGSRSLRPALGAAFGLSRKCHVPISLSTYTRHTCTHMCTHTDTPYAREHTPYVHTHTRTRALRAHAPYAHIIRASAHTHTSCAHILHTRLRLQRQIHVCTLNVCTCLCERAHASTYKDLILYNGMISFYNFLKSGPDCSPGQHRKRGARFLGQTKAERRSPDLGWKRLPPLEFCFLCNTCFLSGDRFLPDIYILNLAFHEAKRY